MDYQPLELNRMQECGSALLKSLQNDAMVPLDLLVRECVQNSLDAAAGPDPVQVSFDIVRHAASAVSSVLGGPIARALATRFGEQSQRCLIVRDANTNGLTGPLKVSELKPGESHGNFMKLVYEIGRSQESSDKGGSWGLGKTVYFRVGVGLVFFYSRISAAKGRFQERLAACLVEDERSPERLQQNSRTGIAWWGTGPDSPVLEPNEIGEILGALGVPRFQGMETGTAIVVPFLRDDLGPPKAQEEDDDGTSRTPPIGVPWWHNQYEDYLAIAIQRWYGMRLNNDRFPGPPLHAFINGNPVTAKDMLPVFRLTQAMYQCCVDSGSRREVQSLDGSAVRVDVYDIAPLRIAFEGSQNAGKVAVALVTEAQLGMKAPHNQLSPHVAIDGRERVGAAAPLVAFLRGHGMVIRWDDRGDSTGWAKGVGAVPDGQYLIAVVVPDGSLRLHSKVVAALGRSLVSAQSLEGYLRRCEQADHHQWTDPVGVTIVRRMRERVAERLKQALPHEAPPVQSAMPFLAARTIADRLLPEGFGTDGRSGTGGISSTNNRTDNQKKRNKLPQLDVKVIRHRKGGLVVDWELRWDGVAAPCILRLLVDSEQKPISRDAWVGAEGEDGLGRFPLAVRSVQTKIVDAAHSKVNSDWAIRAGILEDKAGISLTPIGSRLKRGSTVVLQGTVDIDVQYPGGMPIRAVVALEGTEPRAR